MLTLICDSSHSGPFKSCYLGINTWCHPWLNPLRCIHPEHPLCPVKASVFVISTPQYVTGRLCDLQLREKGTCGAEVAKDSCLDGSQKPRGPNLFFSSLWIQKRLKIPSGL